MDGSDAASERAADRCAAEIGQAQSDKPSTIDYRRLDERLTRLMQEEDMVALAVGVVEHGQNRILKG